MKLLLDTHTFIWWDSEPETFRASARPLSESGEPTCIERRQRLGDADQAAVR